ADLEFHRPATILQILRRSADGGEGVKHIPRADGGVAVDHDMAEQFAPFADNNVGPNDTERPHLHVLREVGVLIDDSHGRDRGHNFVAATPASPSSRPMRRRRRRSYTGSASTNMNLISASAANLSW